MTGAQILPLIARHDLFVFQRAGMSLTFGNREFPLLKWLGKQIVSIPLGFDVRHVPSFLNQYREADVSAEFIRSWSAKNSDDWLPVWNLRLAERFSDLILSQPNQSNLGIRPYMHLFLPIRTERYKCAIPEREIPVVVHAPSNLGFKGTDRILAALDDLRSEGVRFELNVLHRASNPQVLAALADADVVVDQLVLRRVWQAQPREHGVRVCGRDAGVRRVLAVFAGNTDLAHRAEQPAPATEDTVDRSRAEIRLAREGREFVVRRHDHVKVAERILQLLASKRTESHDYYPTFFARQFNLGSEKMPTRLQKITAAVIQRYGLPEDVEPRDLIARGLISPGSLDPAKPVPRWNAGMSR